MNKAEKIVIAIGFATLILAIPGAIVATKQIMPNDTYFGALKDFSTKYWWFYWIACLSFITQTLLLIFMAVVERINKTRSIHNDDDDQIVSGEDSRKSLVKEAIGENQLIKDHIKYWISDSQSLNDELQVGYLIENYCAFPVTLTKFVESRLTFRCNDKSFILPVTSNLENKEIEQRGSLPLKLPRKLDMVTIRKVAALAINSGKNFDPLFLEASGKGYFRGKDNIEIEIPYSTVFRIPHYDLIGLVRTLKEEEEKNKKDRMSK